MLTGARKEKGIQSALNHALKTDPGTLSPSRALEDSPAGTPGQARNGADRNADGQVVREEPGSGRRLGRGSGDPRCGVSRVFVLDRRGDPPVPCHPARARKILKKGRAVAVRLHPFATRLRGWTGGESRARDLKIEPGSGRTGLALMRDDGEVLFLAEIGHRGGKVLKSMLQRAGYRRRRRPAGPRHRKERFLDRRSGRRLPPSLQSRADSTPSWTGRFRRLAPTTGARCETVRFDTQAPESPDIEGVEYQQGTLAGYEVRECPFEKRGRKCAYCDATETPLEVDHLRPKAWGGTDRVSNLTPACPSCNRETGAEPGEVFLAGQPERLRRVLAEATAPLRDAAAVNASCRVLFDGLRRTGLPVSGSSGGRTEFNRARPGIPKSHALDAACVGETPALTGRDQPVPGITAMCRGPRARTRVHRFGIPVGHLMAGKSARGIRAGDIARATVLSGKRQGVQVGRVAVRASGSFNVQAAAGTVQGVSHRHCRIVQRGGGYGYRLDTPRPGETATMLGTLDPAFLPALKSGVSCGADR